MSESSHTMNIAPQIQRPFHTITLLRSNGNVHINNSICNLVEKKLIL